MYVEKLGSRVFPFWQARHKCRGCGALLGVTEFDLFLGPKGEIQFECPCCEVETEIFSYTGDRQLHTRMERGTLRKTCAGVSRTDAPEPMLYQRLKELADEGCPFCPVSSLNLNLAHNFAICPKCGCRRYLDGTTTEPLKKGVKKGKPEKTVEERLAELEHWSERSVEIIEDLQQRVDRVEGRLVLD